jgi:hypothetical protein
MPTAQVCPRCQCQDSEPARQAAAEQLGSWSVWEEGGNIGPPVSLTVVREMIRQGRLTRRSIVRGPTTRQLWCHAERVKGISREFGVCHACGGQVEMDVRTCPACGISQEPPRDPWTVLEESEARPATATAAGLPLIDLPPRAPARQQGVPPAIMAATEMASAYHLARQPRGKKPRSINRLWLLLLIVAALAVAIWLRPDLAEGVKSWIGKQTEALAEWLGMG